MKYLIQYNEKLGVSEDVLNAADYVFGIINKDSKPKYKYIIPITLGKFNVNLHLYIKKMYDRGVFSQLLSNDKKIVVSLQQGNINYSVLVHELKHAFRFLLNGKVDKLEIYNFKSKYYTGSIKHDMEIISYLLYFLSINEFESDYHNMYLSIIGLENRKKEEIDKITELYRVVIKKYPINLDNCFKNEESKISFLYNINKCPLEYNDGDWDIIRNSPILDKIKTFLKKKKILSLSEKEKKDIEKTKKDIENLINNNIRYIRKKLYRLYTIPNLKESKLYEDELFEEARVKWYKDGKLSDPEEIDDETEKRGKDCPFLLYYGKDGKKFKCGDRVTYKMWPGTIVDSTIGETYLICFDKKITGGHTGNKKDKDYNIPEGHGHWVVASIDLKLL